MIYIPGNGNVTVTLVVSVPVNFNAMFCACVGPPLGVGVNPAGAVRVIGELPTLMV
jgi:hypothetical protein